MYKGKDGKIYWETGESNTRERFENTMNVKNGLELGLEQVFATLGRNRNEVADWWKRITDRMKIEGFLQEGESLAYNFTDACFKINEEEQQTP